MAGKVAKALIIIACLTTGIVAVLFAPLQIFQYKRTQTIKFLASINQINLITDSQFANVQIEYATDRGADLINLTYLYTIHSAIIFPVPNVYVSLSNSTFANILTVKVTEDITALGAFSIVSAIIYLTINPILLSNLSIYVSTGNINLDNANSQNKTFVNINLETATGNINVNLANNSQITSDNFEFRTVSGNINLHLSNLSLNTHEILGTLNSTSGNIDIKTQQMVPLLGNLTLNAKTIAGNINLEINLKANYISSFIIPTKGSGNINYIGQSIGFHQIGNNLYSDIPDRSSNIYANLDTTSGNININATRI